MHELEPLRAAARFAEAAHARAARQTLLLLGGEVKETQCQKSRAIRNPAEHLAAAAECHLGEQHFAFDGGALPGAQLAQRHHPGAIFIAQGQQEQEVLGCLHSQCLETRGERLADTAQNRDRVWRDHVATMHSTSTCAPRGSDATPTAARAGYGSRKYSAMILLTSPKCDRSIKNTVALTTSSRLAPAATTMAFRLSKAWRTCASMSPFTSSLVAGSRGICPETQMVLPTLTACE